MKQNEWNREWNRNGEEEEEERQSHKESRSLETLLHGATQWESTVDSFLNTKQSVLIFGEPQEAGMQQVYVWNIMVLCFYHTQMEENYVCNIFTDLKFFMGMIDIFNIFVGSDFHKL